MLVGSSDSSKIVYNAVAQNHNVSRVIEDTPIPLSKFLKRRIKKLGLFTVVGQILFMVYNKYLFRKSKERISVIKEKYKLSTENFPKQIFSKVPSINSSEAIKILQKENPDLVIVNGTRIISKKVLSSIDALFINTHVGITPEYRGVHGGYWALVNNDKKNCGVTVHVVDEGIDTGGVLYQDTIEANHQDNFNTYLYLQIAKAIPLINKAITDFRNNEIKVQKRENNTSVLYSHPTLFQYIVNKVK